MASASIRPRASCPSVFNGSNIKKWKERVILEPLARQPLPDPSKTYEDMDADETPIDVPVKRKG